MFQKGMNTGEHYFEAPAGNATFYKITFHIAIMQKKNKIYV
ncbi:MAG: hypothetical protein ACLRZ7_08205 [Lachnospiraceae bacterium]